MICLAADAGAILRDAGLTIATGVVVVFGVLLLLTGVFKVFGMIVSSTEKGEKNAPAATPVAAPASTQAATPVAAPIVGNTAEVRTAPEIQNGIPEETVAVISAAVASVAPAGSLYAVRGIRKA